MKKILAFGIITFVSVSIQMNTSLPWWSFLVLLFLLGVILPLEKWNVSSFMMGFISGFLVWIMCTIFVATIYSGDILIKVSQLVNVPFFLLFIIIGFIGGISSGLAVYAGFLLRRGKERLGLE